jgi:hypothetical protein
MRNERWHWKQWHDGIKRVMANEDAAAEMSRGHQADCLVGRLPLIYDELSRAGMRG